MVRTFFLPYFNLNAGKINVRTIKPAKNHAMANPKRLTAKEKRIGIQKAPKSEIPFT